MLAQVRTGGCGEHRIHEHVFLGARQVADFVFQFGERGGDQGAGRHVGIEHGGVANDLGHDLRIDGTGGLAVVSAQVILHFLGNHAPALAGQDVEYRLSADDLAHGGYQRRIAHFCADLGDFLHHLVQAVDGILGFQLGNQVAHHAAGNLMAVHLHMEQGGHAALVVVATANFFPVFGDLEQQVQVEAGVITAFLQGSHDHLCCRMAVAECQRRTGDVGDCRAGLCRFEDVGRRHTADIVAVHMDGQADFGIQGLHHTLGAIRGEHAGHVLDGDGIGTHVLQLLGVFQIAVQGVDGADGVADRTFEPAAAFLDGIGVVLDVAGVIQCVEHAEHLHAIALGSLDEAVADLAGIVLIADQVLATGKHGEVGVGSHCLDRSETLPRILIQEAKAGVKGSTAPGLDRPITDTVHLGQNRQHVADRHSRRPQGLLAVANGRIHDLKFWHVCTSFSCQRLHYRGCGKARPLAVALIV